MSVDVLNALGGIVSTATVDLRLRRQKGVPLTEEERGLLDTAIATARLVLDPAEREEDKALGELDDAEDSLIDAREKVTQSQIDSDLAELEDAADQDERALSRFQKAVDALEDAASATAVAQKEALFWTLHTVVDAVFNRLRAVEPSCDEEGRRGLERFGQVAADVAHGDLSSAANTLLKAYSVIQDERYPLGFPSTLPSKKSGRRLRK